jgi:putative inorganic carbon (hco3(-)) transporter
MRHPLSLPAIFNSNQYDLLRIAILISLCVACFSLPLPIQWLAVCIIVVTFSALLSPISALCAVLVLSPLRTLILTESSFSLPLEIGQLTILLLMLSWLVFAITRHKIVIALSFSISQIPLWIFIALAGISIFYALSFSVALVEWIKWLTILGIAIFIPTLIRISHLKWVILVLVASAFANALVGIYTFFGGSGALHLLINDRFFRAFGTFGQPNPFGGFMGLVAPFALAMTLFYTRQLFKYRQWRYASGLLLYAIAFATLCLALFMSWSRGAWLGFIFALVIMAFSLPRKIQYSIAITTSLLLVIASLWLLNLIPASIATRIQSSTQEFFAFEDMRGIDITSANYAVAERLAHWQAALNMAQAHPLGVGIGNYEVAYPQYRLLNWKFALGHAHNFYLNILAEMGIIGLIAYLTFIASLLYLAWQNRQSPDTLTRLLSIACLGALAYLIFHSLLDNLYVNNLFIHIGVIVGIIYHTRSITQRSTQWSPHVASDQHGKTR